MKYLATELGARTKEQLASIYKLWGLTPEASKKSRGPEVKLLQYVNNAVSARFVWEHLSQDERSVLYRVVVPNSRSGIRSDTVQKKAELTDVQFNNVVHMLEEYMLLFVDRMKWRGNQKDYGYSYGSRKQAVEEVDTLHPFSENVNTLYNVGREMFSSTGDRSKMTLDKILSSLYQNDLARILERYDVERLEYYVTRDDARRMVVDALMQPEVVFDGLQKISAKERDLIKWLCTQPEGRANMQEVRAHTGFDDETLTTTLHTLEAYALAFDSLTPQERVLFLPQDVCPVIKKAVERPEPVILPPGLHMLSSTPPVTKTADTLIQYDLAIIINAAYQQTLEPTQAGRVPKRFAAKIAPLLHGLPRSRYGDDEYEYMEMLFNIARELKLLQLSSSALQDVKPHYESGAELEEWSQSNLVEQTKRLIQQWTTSFQWIDIVGANFKRWDVFYWNPMQARPSILPYLQKCVAGEWYSVESLLQTLWSEIPQAMHKQQYNYESLYTAYEVGPGKQKKPTGSAMRAKWMSGDGEVYIGALTSTLYELGIVSLGYQQEDVKIENGEGYISNPDTFMITELGAAVLSTYIAGTASAVEASPTPSTPALLTDSHSLIVQPNFELLLLTPDMPTLYSLLPFAQVNQIETVSRLTLTRSALLRGLSTGMSLEQVLQVLREHSQRDLPQNVEYTLRDWAKQYKGAMLSQVILLEVSDEAVADEVCTSASLKRLGLRRLGPRAIVSKGDINILRRALDKEGISVNIVSTIPIKS